MRIIVLVTVLGFSAAAPVFINDGEVQYNPSPYAHEAVLTNSAMESMLPSELRNHFYDNPHTAAALAQQSWLGYKEMQVKFFLFSSLYFYLLCILQEKSLEDHF